jgi:L-lactate dehydrogenase complex protein LldE
MLTCLCDAFYPGVGQAAVRCLEHRGYKVAFEQAQTCCSQPAFNSGDWVAARKVARHVLQVFSGAKVLVTPSGSCAAMIRWGMPQLFRGEPELEEALSLARRTWELLEFLALHEDLTSWPGQWKGRAVLHRSCHLRELQPHNGAEALLSSIGGLELSAPRTPEQCCGFGGTFTVSFPWTSQEMGSNKLADLSSAAPDVIASTDMGCVMHLRGMASRPGGAPMPRLLHVAELLAESLPS